MFSELPGAGRCQEQRNEPGIDDDLAAMFKIDGYPFFNNRLYLPKAPIGLLGMGDEITGFKTCCCLHKILQPERDPPCFMIDRL